MRRTTSSGFVFTLRMARIRAARSSGENLLLTRSDIAAVARIVESQQPEDSYFQALVDEVVVLQDEAVIRTSRKSRGFATTFGEQRRTGALARTDLVLNSWVARGVSAGLHQDCRRQLIVSMESCRRGVSVTLLVSALAVDDETKADVCGADIISHPLDALAALANDLAESGRGLMAREMSITGSIVAPQSPERPVRISASGDGSARSRSNCSPEADQTGRSRSTVMRCISRRAP